jgi:hypothetical protein
MKTRPVPNPDAPWRIAAMSAVDSQAHSALSQKQFIIVPGIERCGTTGFHEFLRTATEIALPNPKEIEFFSFNFDRGFEWYLSHYDTRKSILVDASPSYHWNNPALWRIRECCPDVLMVLMLRHPVARAYSAYCHRLNWFFPEDFAIRRNLESYNLSISEVAKLKSEEVLGFEFLFASYKDAIDRILGEYNAGFGEWQFLPVVMEEFIINPTPVVHQIERRLNTDIGVPPGQVVPKANSASFPRFYLGSNLLDVHGAERLGLDRNSSYICRNGKLTRIADADSYQYLKQLEQKWLQPLTSDAAEFIFETFYKHELSEIEERFGLRLDCWREIKEYHPKKSRTPFEFV